MYCPNYVGSSCGYQTFIMRFVIYMESHYDLTNECHIDVLWFGVGCSVLADYDVPLLILA